MTFFSKFYIAALKSLSSLASASNSPSISLLPPPNLTRCPVTRGEYSGVLDKLVGNPGGQFTITGPTGCGKSTWALVPLIQSHRVMIICPTRANAANLLAEFGTRMPATAKAIYPGVLFPMPVLVDFTVYQEAPSPLLISTCESFLTFVKTYHALPPVEYIIHDEYHLNSGPNIAVRTLLRCVADSPANKVTRIFVSATPPGEPAPPPRLTGMTVIPMTIPDPLLEPTPPIYRLKRHVKHANNYLLIIVDSCECAHLLCTRLRDLGERVFLMCACPSVETVASFLRTVHSSVTVIGTSDTEAGLTCPASIMVNPAISSSVLYASGVVALRTFPLGPAAANQRLGRAGRVNHTLVYNQTNSGSTFSDAPSPVLLAEAYLLLLALSGEHPVGGEFPSVTTTFPKLLTLTRAAAITASSAATPLLEIYRRDASGATYAEFGGVAPGFIAQNAADFRLFTWPSGCSYGPYLDLTRPHDLEAGMTTALQESMAKAIAVTHPAAAQALTFEQVLAEVRSDPGMLLPSVWKAFAEFDGLPTAQVDRASFPTKPHASNFAPMHSAEYMFGPQAVELWRLVQKDGGRLLYDVYEDGPAWRLRRMLSYRGSAFQYHAPPELLTNNIVDPAKIAARMVERLQPVMVAAKIRNDKSLSTSLVALSDLGERSGNPWFKAILTKHA
jgi:hypothetical protein